MAAITVNCNARVLTAQVLYSLYARPGNQEMVQMVVVDNASTDGSRELLGRMAVPAPSAWLTTLISGMRMTDRLPGRTLTGTTPGPRSP